MRAEVEEVLSTLKARSTGEAALKANYEKTEIVLVYFVDWAVHQPPALAGSWPTFAVLQRGPGGDEDSSTRLDKTIKDPRPRRRSA